MAKAPSYFAKPFSIQEVGVKLPTRPDISGVQNIADELIRRGAEENINAAFEEGQRDQNTVGGKELKKREKSFFSSKVDDAYNKGARVAFGIHKEQEITKTVEDLARQYEHDQSGFEQAFNDQKFKEKLFENVDIKDLAAFQNIANKHFNSHENKIRSAIRARDQNEQLVTFTDEATRNRRSLALEAEQNGEVDPGTLAKQQAFYQALLDSKVSAGTVAAWKAADEMAIRQSKVIFEYDRSQDKDAYYKSLDETNGPLKDLPASERSKIISVLSSRNQERLADATARRTLLTNAITDAISIEASGKQAQTSLILLQQAARDPKLAEKAKDLAVAMANREKVNELRQMPTDTVQATLNSLRSSVKAQGGHTELTAKLEDSLAKILEENQKAASQNDMLSLAFSRGKVELQQATPFAEVQDRDSRVMAVERTRTFYGQANYYTKKELDSFEETWKTADIDKRRVLLSNIVQNTPPSEISGVLKQVSTKNPEMGFLVSALANPDERVQRLVPDILEGTEYANNNKELVEKKTELVRLMKNALTPYLPLDRNGEMTDMLAQSAFGLYVQNERRKNNGLLERPSSMGPEKAVKEILGIGEDEFKMNGTKVMPFEPYMSSSAMREIWKGTTVDDLKAMNNDRLPVDNAGLKSNEVNFKRVKDEGMLVYKSPGVYMIALPEKPKPMNPNSELFDDVKVPERKYFLVNPETKKPYEFRYRDKATEFKKRVLDKRNSLPSMSESE